MPKKTKRAIRQSCRMTAANESRVDCDVDMISYSPLDTYIPTQEEY